MCDDPSFVLGRRPPELRKVEMDFLELVNWVDHAGLRCASGAAIWLPRVRPPDVVPVTAVMVEVTDGATDDPERAV